MPSWKFAVHPAGGGPGLKPRNRREVTSREPVAALAARWTPAGCRLGGSGGGGLSPQGLRGPEGWASCGAGMGPGGQGGGGGRGSGGEGPASSRSGPAFSPQPARVEAGDWNGDHGVYPGPAPHQPVTSQVTSGSIWDLSVHLLPWEDMGQARWAGTQSGVPLSPWGDRTP